MDDLGLRESELDLFCGGIRKEEKGQHVVVHGQCQALLRGVDSRSIYFRTMLMMNK